MHCVLHLANEETETQRSSSVLCNVTQTGSTERVFEQKYTDLEFMLLISTVDFVKTRVS